MSTWNRAPYVQDNEKYYLHANVLGAYSRVGRLAKLTREVDLSPLVLDKSLRPQISNLYQYHTFQPGQVQRRYAYFNLDNAYGRP